MNSIDETKNQIIALSKNRSAEFGSFGEYLVYNFYTSDPKNKVESIRGHGVLADFEINGRKIDVKSTASLLAKEFIQFKIPRYNQNRVDFVDYEQVFFLKDKVILVSDFSKGMKPTILSSWLWDKIRISFSIWEKRKRTRISFQKDERIKKIGSMKKSEIIDWYESVTSTKRIRPFYRGPHNSLWSQKDQPDNGYPSSPDKHDFSVFLQISELEEVKFVIAFPHNALREIPKTEEPSKRQLNKRIETIVDLRKMEMNEKYANFNFESVEELKAELFKRFPFYAKKYNII